MMAIAMHASAVFLYKGSYQAEKGTADCQEIKKGEGLENNLLQLFLLNGVTSVASWIVLDENLTDGMSFQLRYWTYQIGKVLVELLNLVARMDTNNMSDL